MITPVWKIFLFAVLFAFFAPIWIFVLNFCAVVCAISTLFGFQREEPGIFGVIASEALDNIQRYWTINHVVEPHKTESHSFDSVLTILNR